MGLKLKHVLLLLVLVLALASLSFAGSYGDLETASGWFSCTAILNGHPCASGLGNATYSKGISGDPSLDGFSGIFTIGGPVRYSNALWWKPLPAVPSAMHFVYDVYFYVKNPNVVQALEFDVNQSHGTNWFVFGTECNYKDSHMWDVWDTGRETWIPTAVPCPVVQAYTWHHLQWEFARLPNNTVQYVAVTLDGHKSYVNRVYGPPRAGNGDSLNVAFQMDGDYRQDSYSVWLDKLTLDYW